MSESEMRCCRRQNVIRSVVIGFLVTAASASPAAQEKTSAPSQDVDVIRISTTLVTVPVRVMDRNGRFIAGLQQEQFHLYEAGIEQQIAFFENATSPFTVALLLDASDSTVHKLRQIKDAAAAFTTQLRPDDRVLIMTFDKRISVLCELTSDRRLLASAIDRAQSGGGTSLYDAIDSVMVRLRKVRGRKAIVVFTDGVDTTSRVATYESTLRAAEELDALIYTIQFDTYSDVTRSRATASSDPTQNEVITSTGERLDVAYKRGARYLRLLSDKTAGRFYYAAGLDRLKEIFAAIAAELREFYSLGFYPGDRPGAKRTRELRVKVSVPNVSIRHRRSYVYAAPSP